MLTPPQMNDNTFIVVLLFFALCFITVWPIFVDRYQIWFNKHIGKRILNHMLRNESTRPDAPADDDNLNAENGAETEETP